MESAPGIRIPVASLAPETLRAVLEELVTRDGTDLVDAEIKIREVARLLERGEVELWYDPERRTCSIARRAPPSG